MKNLTNFTSRLFVEHIHGRCGLKYVDTSGISSLTSQTWESLFHDSTGFLHRRSPIRVTGVDESIVQHFSGWRSGSFLLPGKIPVRSAPNSQGEEVTYGDSQSSGYMSDVYKNHRSVCSTDAFVDWLEYDSKNTTGMYLAGVPLSTVCETVPEFPIPSKLRQLVVPGSPLIYMGKGNQRTPLHFDPTGNLTIVVRGKKTFDLFPPSSSHLLNPIGGILEAVLSWYGGWVPAVYSRYRGDEASLKLVPGRIQVQLEAGEALWIPPCWWHAVCGGKDPNVILVYGTRPG